MSFYVEINTYDEAGSFLKRILPDAFGQPVGSVLGRLRAHQHPPQSRVFGALQQPRRAITRFHLAAQALGVSPVAEGAHLDSEQSRDGSPAGH